MLITFGENAIYYDAYFLKYLSAKYANLTCS